MELNIVDLSSDVEHIDPTAAAADGSQIADLLSLYDAASTEAAEIKAEAASSQEPHLGVEEEDVVSAPEPDDSKCPVCREYISAHEMHLHVNQCLDRQENDAANPAPSAGASSGGASGTPGTTGGARSTPGTKRETAIRVDDDSDDEVQIFREEPPGKRRAVERQQLQGSRSAAQRLPPQPAERQRVLVVCGEGSKQQRITLRLQPRVPLIYLYSVPAVAEALKAQLQLKEHRSADAGVADAGGGGGGGAGGGGTADDVMKLAKHFQIVVERREFDHVRAQSATIRAVSPGAAIRIRRVSDELTDHARWAGDGPRKGEVEGVQIVRLAYQTPLPRQFAAQAQAAVSIASL